MMVVRTGGPMRTRSFPSGLMRRLGFQDAREGRERQHGSPEYRDGYEAGLRVNGLH